MMQHPTIDPARRRFLLAAGKAPLAASLAAGGLLPGFAHAQAVWPSKTVRIVVPSAPGTLTDVLGRFLSDGMSKALGQSTFVDNKPGAASMIGVGEVVRAAPDGHTLVVTNGSSVAIQPQLNRKIPYRTADLAPVTMLLQAGMILVVNSEWAQKNRINKLSDYLAWARANPEKLRYGTSGVGGLPHLVGIMVANRAGVNTLHVPYKTAASAQLAVVSGEVESMYDSLAIMPHLQSGKLKALAVTSGRRMGQLPDVPTIEESGVPDIDLTFWMGLFAPAGTPAPVLQRIHAATKAIMEEPKARAYVESQGEFLMLEPTRFAQRLERETAMWGDIIRRENLQVD